MAGRGWSPRDPPGVSDCLVRSPGRDRSPGGRRSRPGRRYNRLGRVRGRMGDVCEPGAASAAPECPVPYFPDSSPVSGGRGAWKKGGLSTLGQPVTYRATGKARVWLRWRTLPGSRVSAALADAGTQHQVAHNVPLSRHPLWACPRATGFGSRVSDNGIMSTLVSRAAARAPGWLLPACDCAATKEGGGRPPGQEGTGSSSAATKQAGSRPPVQGITNKSPRPSPLRETRGVRGRASPRLAGRGAATPAAHCYCDKRSGGRDPRRRRHCRVLRAK